MHLLAACFLEETCELFKSCSPDYRIIYYYYLFTLKYSADIIKLYFDYKISLRLPWVYEGSSYVLIPYQTDLEFFARL